MNYYIIVHIFAILSLVVDFWALLAGGAEYQHILAVLSSTGGLLCSVSLLCFGLALLRKEGLNRFIVITMYLVPVIFLVSALLADPSLILEQSSGLQKPGPLYKLISGMEYLLRLSSCTVLAVSVAKRVKISIFEVFMVVLAMASFTLKIVISLQKPVYMVPIGPFMALILFGLLFYGSAKLGMLNLISLGIIRSMELYSEAIFIVDNKGNRTYLNPACKRLNADTFQAIYAFCCSEAQHFSDAVQEEKILELEHNNGLYTISIRPVKTLLQHRTGLICVIHDDTAMKTAINNLKEKNEKLVMMHNSIRMLQSQISHLATIEERNSLAKEIHDVMGHSLNLALHTLESNWLILDQQPEKAIMRLRQVISDIDRGIGEIAVHESTDSQSPLWSLLAEMTDRLAEIGVRLEVIRSRWAGKLTDEMIKAIYRICQEATTNAIKHGKADHITVSIKGKRGLLHIYIIDNGKGCSSMIKGNGLRGMEERAESLGGSVSFSSFEDGNGFMVHASIPLGSRPEDE